MSGAGPPGPTPPRRGAPRLTTVLFAGIMVLFGLVSGLPALLGPIVVLGGVGVSAYLRPRLGPRRSSLEVVPALLALSVVGLGATPGRSTELFAGLSALAFLLWLADDPRKEPGGGRRAAPALGLAALAFALAWGITLPFPPGTIDVGLAGGLIAAALVLVAVVLVRWVLGPRAETA